MRQCKRRRKARIAISRIQKRRRIHARKLQKKQKSEDFVRDEVKRVHRILNRIKPTRPA